MAGGMRAVIGEAAAQGSRLPYLLFSGQPTAPLNRLEARIDEILTTVRRLAEAHETGNPAARAAPAAEAQAVWLFLPSPTGYRLHQANAAARTKRGDLVTYGDSEYRVATVGRSPLLDGRRCLYLNAQHPPTAVEAART